MGAEDRAQKKEARNVKGAKKGKKRKFEIWGEQWGEVVSREQTSMPGSPIITEKPGARVVVGEQGQGHIELLPLQ